MEGSAVLSTTPASILVMEDGRTSALCCITNRNKENVDPLASARTPLPSASPLPSCYQRTPLQDITALFPSSQELEEGNLHPRYQKLSLKPKPKLRNSKARYDPLLISYAKQHSGCCGREGAIPSFNNNFYYFR